MLVHGGCEHHFRLFCVTVLSLQHHNSQTMRAVLGSGAIPGLLLPQEAQNSLLELHHLMRIMAIEI